MKRKLSITGLLTNLLLAVMVGMFMSVSFEVDPVASAGVVLAVGTVPQLLFPNFFVQQGSLMAGVYREIWTGRLVEQFRPEIEASFLNTIPDYDRYVQASKNNENEVIHLVDIGADPDVLINNSSYPIDTAAMTESDLPFSLDKYQTKATKVTDDELYGITYEKIDKAVEKHKNAILGTKFKKAAFSLAPNSHSSATPIIPTAGSTVNGKKIATLDDLLALGKAMTDAGIPNDGNRVVVLDDLHVFEMAKEDKSLFKDYIDIASGKLRPRLMGFQVFNYSDNPFYVTAGGAKASFGTVFNGSTHSKASFAFYAPDMFRATGSTKMYYDEPDTRYQATFVNFRHYFLTSPKKARAIAALVTANA